MNEQMNNKNKKQYIWEYLLSGANEEIYFEQAKVWDPYGEVVEVTEDNRCIYNALHRYENVFLKYFQENGIPKSDSEKMLFDVCSHILAGIDIKEGFSYREYERRRIGEDIELGMYGVYVKDVYNSLSVSKKNIVMHYLEMQNRTAGAAAAIRTELEIYKKAVIELLGTGVLYKDKYHAERYILYVGCSRNSEQEKLIQLAQILFLPLGYEVRLLWDKHFGLLGAKQTMELDEIYMM